MFRLRSLGFSNAAFRNSVAVTAAAALGVACGNSGGAYQSGPAHAEVSADANEPVTRTKDNVWYPNTTTKHWHFYKGKMNPNSAKSLKLFKCADTPIADEIAAYLGVSLNKMEVKRFADGETSILVDDGVRGKRVYIVCSTTTVDRLMELLLSISAMRRSSAKSITAVIPFYGYARQDRMHKGREPVAAADIARMLEVMGVDHVVTVDLHSAQVEGFFKPQIPVDNLQAFPVGSVYFSEMQLTNPIVIAPHSSAVNRAVLFRDILSRSIDEAVPLAFVVRNHHIDKSLPGELVGDVTGKDCIIVDNLVDTGSTLVRAAKVLKSSGAKSVSAFCVHGRFSAESAKKIEECEELDLLVTTNTIPTHMESREKSSKIVTLSVAPFIAEVISCIHTKSSIIQVTKTKSILLFTLPHFAANNAIIREHFTKASAKRTHPSSKRHGEAVLRHVRGRARAVGAAAYGAGAQRRTRAAGVLQWNPGHPAAASAMYLDFYHFDFIFPVIYTTFLSGSLACAPVTRDSRVWLVSVLGAVADVLENASTYFLLLKFPQQYEQVELALAVFGSCKYFILVLSAALVMLGGVLHLVRVSRGWKDASGETEKAKAA